MQPSLDLLDRRILFELDCYSRRSLSELARKVRLGRDLVTYRLERLQAEGILRRATALINPYKLGLTVYKTYLKLEAQKDRWNEFVNRLDQHPKTSWLAECYGKWDMIWCVYAHTPKEIYDLQDQMFSDYRDIIPSYNVTTLVNHWWFPKKYLLGKSVDEVQGWGFQPPEFTFGATPAQHVPDELEVGLIRLLCDNARFSTKELAERLNTTPAIVKYRMQKLERLGIIAGYRVDIDRSRLGMTLFKVQVHPRDYDVEKEAAFHSFVRNHPQIAEYHQQIGDCKLEFLVEAADYGQFSTVIDEVREQFSSYIRNMEYMMVKEDYFHRTPCDAFRSVNEEIQPLSRIRETAFPLTGTEEDRALVL